MRGSLRLLLAACLSAIHICPVLAQGFEDEDPYGHVSVPEHGYERSPAEIARGEIQKQALDAYVACLLDSRRRTRGVDIVRAMEGCSSERAAYGATLPEGMEEMLLQRVDFQVSKHFGG